MKKKILFIFLLIPLLFISVSCDGEKDYKIYEGYIVDKIYEPSYTYVTIVRAGKTTVPITHHVPEKYYIVIYKNEKISKHKVTKEFYTNFEVGAYVTVGNEQLEDEVGEDET
jgi:hypothetical protein